MQTVNSNLPQLFQVSNTNNTTVSLNSVLNNKNSFFADFSKDFAFKVELDMLCKMLNFDDVMTNVVAFKDLVDTAQNSVGSMTREGESIRSLLQKAREEELSPESLDALEKEVNTRIAEISRLRNATNYNGINPFNNAVSLEIPNWQDLFGDNFFETQSVNEESSDSSGLQNVIAEFNVDMSIEGSSNNKSFNMGATAKIQIGYNDEGSLVVTVDATMDFDLSGISENGVKSDESWDIINRFLELLNGMNSDFNNASSMFDSMMAKGSASIMGNGFAIDATNEINMEKETSSSLKGQIVQHATITLDSTANQTPSIAINLL